MAIENGPNFIFDVSFNELFYDSLMFDVSSIFDVIEF